MSPRPTSIDRITGGDPADTARFRANLATYARRSDRPEVKALVADVLAGRRDVSEVLRSEDFNAVGERHLDNLLLGMERLEPEEKAQVARIVQNPLPVGDRTPDAELAALRDADLPPGGWAPEDAAPPPDRERLG